MIRGSYFSSVAYKFRPFALKETAYCCERNAVLLVETELFTRSGKLSDFMRNISCAKKSPSIHSITLEHDTNPKADNAKAAVTEFTKEMEGLATHSRTNGSQLVAHAPFDIVGTIYIFRI